MAKPLAQRLALCIVRNLPQLDPNPLPRPSRLAGVNPIDPEGSFLLQLELLLDLLWHGGDVVRHGAQARFLAGRSRDARVMERSWA